MKNLLLLILTLTSPPLFAQWIHAPNSENVYFGYGGFGMVGDTLFTGAEIVNTSDANLKALYKSGDQGLSWEKVNAESGLTNQNIFFLSVSNVDSLLFLASNRYLQSSKDGGRNWEIDGDFQQGDEHVLVHFVKQGNVVIGAAQGSTNDGADGVFKKVGDGEWEAANEGLPDGKDGEIAPQIFDMIVSEDRILLTAGTDVYFSDDTAKTWDKYTGNGVRINKLASGNGIVLGSGHEFFKSSYLYKSTDNGINFERITIPQGLSPGSFSLTFMNSLEFIDGVFYAGIEASSTENGGVYYSSDGENWELLGLKGSRVTSVTHTKDYILAAVNYSYVSDSLLGVWAFPKSELMTTFNEISEEPSLFKLEQNYPNPFNPTTTISFSLNQSENVTLNVFNSLGQKVATLVDGVKASGTHSVQFNASSLSSGLYSYQIQANGKVSTKKMLLIK